MTVVDKLRAPNITLHFGAKNEPLLNQICSISFYGCPWSIASYTEYAAHSPAVELRRIETKGHMPIINRRDRALEAE